MIYIYICNLVIHNIANTKYNYMEIIFKLYFDRYIFLNIDVIVKVYIYVCNLVIPNEIADD